MERTIRTPAGAADAAAVTEVGEHRVGLGVDAASDTGAFRLYERARMAPVLGWVVYEKELGEDA
jgi:hypothetical protein